MALVPKEKILVNKSIESLVQDTESVTVTCEDKSTYTADILIGADGSDSGTRRALYKDMEKDGLTPKIIEEENKTLYMSVFGTTDPMDPANFEGLDDDCTRCDTVVGDERGLTVRPRLYKAESVHNQRGKALITTFSFSPLLLTSPPRQPTPMDYNNTM